jgi:hypothetical protein
MPLHAARSQTRRRHSRFFKHVALGTALLALVALGETTATSQTAKKPYKVTISEEKEQVAEVILPVDPQIQIHLGSGPNMSWGLRTLDQKRLTFSDGSAQTMFKIDGNKIYPGSQQGPLPPRKNSKLPRHGMMYTYKYKDLDITMTQEVVPSKLPGPPKAGQKRKMDTALFKYVIDNKGNQPVNFALRVRIDMYNWTTDGPACWAPTTMPGQILDGVALEGKKVPEYLVNIQNRDLNNPGHLAYFTFNQGGRWEMPSKVVWTSHGAGDMGWEVQVIPGMFDTDIVMFWEERPVKPKEKRIIMFGYGTGLATNPENEGRVTTVLGGSFEPKKSFTITAYVDDPVEGQHLRLNLPDGVAILDGKETQPVPVPDQDNRSLVMWKCHTLKTGTFPIQVISSNGITLTKTVTVEKAE